MLASFLRDGTASPDAPRSQVPAFPRTRGKPIVIVGDPEHDRLGQAIFSAVRKCTHLLTPLTPMIGVIGQ
jgi:hypothetical protein